jgi:hypothetical protein
MKKWNRLILPILLISFLSAGHATPLHPDQDDTTTENTGTEALARKCNNRIIAAPIFFYTPETKIAYGAASSYVMRFAGCNEGTRPSNISSVLIFTQEKQFSALLKGEFYLKNNDYRLLGEFKIDKFPNKYYGIGSDAREEDEENYTPRSTNLTLSAYKKIGTGYNIGLQYNYRHWNIIKTEFGGVLETGEILGSGKGTISGVTIIANRDTRDNVYFPRKGDWFVFSAGFYPEFLGSTHEFTTFKLDLRKYLRVFDNHVVALQAITTVQGGDVPFMSMPQLGGQYLMRGYYYGRFRDKSMAAFQAEYRAPLFWRLGVVGFAGIANVADKFTSLTKGSFKPSYGLGLRYLFDKKENIYIRVDIGFGENGSNGFYVSIFEAF